RSLPLSLHDALPISLLAGELEPARERALADPVDPRDLGLAALAGLVGRERPLAQVGGVGTRHRSPPVGVETIPTADRGAGSVEGDRKSTRLNSSHQI